MLNFQNKVIFELNMMRRVECIYHLSCKVSNKKEEHPLIWSNLEKEREPAYSRIPFYLGNFKLNIQNKVIFELSVMRRVECIYHLSCKVSN